MSPKQTRPVNPAMKEAVQGAIQERRDRLDPLKQALPRNLHQADAFISNAAACVTVMEGADFLRALNFRELTLLRQATLRAHRKAVGPFGQGDPTIAELDSMIAAVGPQACESMIRKAVDDRRGEYDRGRFGHGTANDDNFQRLARKT